MAMESVELVHEGLDASKCPESEQQAVPCVPDTRRLLRARRCQLRRHCRDPHRRGRLRGHRPARPAAYRGAGAVVAAVSGLFRGLHRGGLPGLCRARLLRERGPAVLGGTRNIRLAAASGTLLSGSAPSNKTIWRIAAFSPGVWGNDLDILARETHRAQTLTDPKRGAPEYLCCRFDHRVCAGNPRPPDTGRDNVLEDRFRRRCRREKLAGEKRLIWVHDKLEARRHYWVDETSKVQRYYDDTPLTGFAANLPILVESVEYTLLVRELGRLIRVYEGLSLVPDHERYGPRVLAKLEIPKETDTAKTLPSAPEPVVIEEMRDPDGLLSDWLVPLAVKPDVSLPLEGGADGLALLGVYDFIGEEISPLDSDELKQQKQRGLRALEEVDEVAIVAVPDIHIQPLAIPPKSPLPPCVPDPCLSARPSRDGSSTGASGR